MTMAQVAIICVFVMFAISSSVRLDGYIEESMTLNPAVWFFSDDLKVALHFQADGNFLLKKRDDDEMENPPYWNCGCFDKIWQSGTSGDATDPQLSFDATTGHFMIHETSNPSIIYYINTLDPQYSSKPPFYFVVSNSQIAYVLNSANEVVWSTSPDSPHPTFAPPTTASPTSTTTEAPTTLPPSAAPTTTEPTTHAPTTAAPSTGAPTSADPTTSAPTSSSPTTSAPTSASPTTGAPTSSSPTSATYTGLPTNTPTFATNLPTNAPVTTTTEATTTTTNVVSVAPTEAPITSLTNPLSSQATFDLITSTNMPSYSPLVTTENKITATTTEEPSTDAVYLSTIMGTDSVSTHSDETVVPSDAWLLMNEQNIILLGVVVCLILCLILMAIVCVRYIVKNYLHYLVQREKGQQHVVHVEHIAANMQPRVVADIEQPGEVHGQEGAVNKAVIRNQNKPFVTTFGAHSDHNVVNVRNHVRIRNVTETDDNDSLYTWEPSPGKMTSPGLETATSPGLETVGSGTSVAGGNEGEGQNNYQWVERLLMNVEDDANDRNEYLDNFKRHKIDDELLKSMMISQDDAIWKELVPAYGVRLKFFKVLYGMSNV